jgi:regulator of sigma E protease
MGGPVMMMQVYYRFFQMDFADGWRLAFWFSVVLNVNLAMINLLPIPVLDGGHITLALIEGIRRRPVNVRVLEFIQTGCAVMIIGFMLYIAFFDVQDLFGGGRPRRQTGERVMREHVGVPQPGLEALLDANQCVRRRASESLARPA